MKCWCSYMINTDSVSYYDPYRLKKNVEDHPPLAKGFAVSASRDDTSRWVISSLLALPVLLLSLLLLLLSSPIIVVFKGQHLSIYHFDHHML